MLWRPAPVSLGFKTCWFELVLRMWCWFDNRWRRNFRPVFGIGANPVSWGIIVATDLYRNRNVLKKIIDLSRVWIREPWISSRVRYSETTEADIDVVKIDGVDWIINADVWILSLVSPWISLHHLLYKLSYSILLCCKIYKGCSEGLKNADNLSIQELVYTHIDGENWGGELQYECILVYTPIVVHRLKQRIHIRTNIITMFTGNVKPKA